MLRYDISHSAKTDILRLSKKDAILSKILMANRHKKLLIGETLFPDPRICIFNLELGKISYQKKI